MAPQTSPLAGYRSPLEDGYAWNMVDEHDRWTLDVRVPARVHMDGLLAVEALIEEMRDQLGFAVDATWGDPVAND